jgi:putative mRNA 3-end processing factor
MRPIELLVPTQAGLHCPLGAFYIDPVRPVARALVTHAHSDHALSGHEAVLATAETLDLMRLRYGEDFAGTTQAVGYGETVRLDGVSITFHPAGHVLGSAQIAVVRGPIRIVVSTSPIRPALRSVCAISISMRRRSVCSGVSESAEVSSRARRSMRSGA